MRHAINLTEEHAQEVPDNPVDALKREIRDQAIDAIEQMHLATAIQRIVELEKIRLLESGEVHRTLSIRQHSFSVPAEIPPSWQPSNKRPVPLIGADHHFSASALKKYQDCPLCYKFQYVLQVPSLPKTFFSMGTAVHAVIEHLSKQQLEGVPPTREQALALLDSYWSSEAYTSHAHELEDRAKAEAMLDTYLTWQAANQNTIIGNEKKFRFPINGRMVKGYIDRVEQTPEGGYVVIDFKTGSLLLCTFEKYHQNGYPDEPVLPRRPGYVREAAGPGIALLR